MIPEGFKAKMKLLLEEDYGSFISVIENEEAVRGLRLNLIKSDANTNIPFPLRPLDYVSNGFILDSTDPVGSDPLHHAGAIYMQDPGAMATAAAIDVEPHWWVADLCAAPGGKSFLAAILSGDGATVYSHDIHESKMSLIEGGAVRLGLKSIRASVRDAEMPDEHMLGKADKVICDAPCSGLGVISKKPDLRYKSEESVSSLPELQLSILESSAGYLSPGGVLIYSTCTLLPEENGGVVDRFLERHPDFEPEEFCVGGLRSEHGMLELLPHKDFTDGFFIAKLRKVK